MAQRGGSSFAPMASLPSILPSPSEFVQRWTTVSPRIETAVAVRGGDSDVTTTDLVRRDEAGPG